MLKRILVALVLIVVAVLAYLIFFSSSNPISIPFVSNSPNQPNSPAVVSVQFAYQEAGVSLPLSQINLPDLEKLSDSSLNSLQANIVRLQSESNDPVEQDALRIHQTLINLAITSKAITKTQTQLDVSSNSCESLSTYEEQARNWKNALNQSVLLQQQINDFITTYPQDSIKWNFNRIESLADTNARNELYQSGVSFLKETCTNGGN